MKDALVKVCTGARLASFSFDHFLRPESALGMHHTLETGVQKPTSGAALPALAADTTLEGPYNVGTVVAT